MFISLFFLSDRVSFSHSLLFLRCHSVIMAFSCILGDNMDPTMGPKPGKIFIISNIFLDVLSWISWSVYFHSDVVIKYSLFILNSSRPGQNGRHFPDDIFKMHFHEWKNLYFDWSLFLRVQLTIFQHWFRKWLGADQATSHYLNQCWPISLMHICGTRGRWVNVWKTETES